MRTLIGALAVGVASGADTGSLHAANPIRKVVTLLQNMEKKVSSDAEKEKEVFDKFMCYCKNGGTALAKSIADAGNHMPELESDIKAGEANLVQLKEDLGNHQTDRAAAKSAIATATAVREKEAAAFSAEETELKTNIGATNKAITAIENGMGGSFLQTAAAMTLKKIVLNIEGLNDGERSEITSFLADDSEYAPSSGEITGILKTMVDEMNEDLKATTATETSAIKSFEGVVASKTKQIEALTKMIEKKMRRVGELGVEIVQMKNDLGETGEALLEDKKFLADLDNQCATKEKLYAENVKLRGGELLALQDTIKMLNSDDALELFKKSLPGASSFMQVEASASAVVSRVSEILKNARQGSQHRPSLDFIVLALHGKKEGFGKVIKLIDSLVTELKAEQVEDENKKEYCEVQFELAEDKKKTLEQDISDAEKNIADDKETVKTLLQEIDGLEDGIRALDKQVADATEQRKEEASDYQTLMANNMAAKELLGMAKNRLNKFYNPKLASALQSRADPGPAPEGPKAYSKDTEGGNGVVAMIDVLIKDLDKEITEAEFTEKDAQEDYETMMKDAAQKRAEDSKAITDKNQAKADTDARIEETEASHKSAVKQLMATEEYISQLHADCDWLIKYFDLRKEARTNEIDALSKAKAVLSGADFSFLQRRSKHFLGSF